MKTDDRGYSALAHILAILPGWGIFFNVILWLNFKSRSHEVSFHARQAILFQVIFLLPVLIVMLVAKVISKLIGLVSETIGNILNSINWMIIVLAMVFYVLYCLYGFFRVRTGHPFEYIFAGKWVKSFLKELE